MKKFLIGAALSASMIVGGIAATPAMAQDYGRGGYSQGHDRGYNNRGYDQGYNNQGYEQGYNDHGQYDQGYRGDGYRDGRRYEQRRHYRDHRCDSTGARLSAVSSARCWAVRSAAGDMAAAARERSLARAPARCSGAKLHGAIAADGNPFVQKVERAPGDGRPLRLIQRPAASRVQRVRSKGIGVACASDLATHVASPRPTARYRPQPLNHDGS